MEEDNGKDDEKLEDGNRCHIQIHGDKKVESPDKRDVDTKKKRKHITEFEKEKASRYDIFCVDIKRDSSFEQVNFELEIKRDKTALQGHSQKRRKKKTNHLQSLKKSSGQIAVLPPISKIKGRNLPLSDNTLQVLPDILPEGHDILQEKSGFEIVQEAGGKRKGAVDETSKNKIPSDKATDDVLKPFKICTFIARFPVLSFLITLSVHVIALVVTIALLTTGSDVFPLVFDDLPLILMNDARLRDLAWRQRFSYPNYIYRPVYDTQVPTWWRGQLKDTVEVIYEAPGENILTYKQFKLIEAAEKSLYELPDYHNLFCRLESDASCTKPQSLLRLFDGTFRKINPVFYSPNFSDVYNVIYFASIYNETKMYLNLFVGKDFKMTRNYSITSITRSFFLMGWPLYTYGPYQGTLTDLENFLMKQFKPGIEWIRNNLMTDSADVYYISKMMFELDLIQQAIQDSMLSIGSFVFICLFMCIQMASLTITFLGIASILSSFLMTNLLYRYVFQYRYFGFFHVIIIFLILGIGADDLFVFYDTWRLTGHSEYPSDAHRLSDCYRRAAKTTFVTSVTTMAAFLINGFSPLMPVSTCGIFAGVLVAINYISVITYFPTVIMLHHTKMKGCWYKCHSVLLRTWTSGTKTDNNQEVDGNNKKISKPRSTNINKIDVSPTKSTDHLLASGGNNSGSTKQIYIDQEVSDGINMGDSCENTHDKDMENENGSRMSSFCQAIESHGVCKDDIDKKDCDSISRENAEDNVYTLYSKTVEEDMDLRSELNLDGYTCLSDKMETGSRFCDRIGDSNKNLSVQNVQNANAKSDTLDSYSSQNIDLTANTNMSKPHITEDFDASRNVADIQRCQISGKASTRRKSSREDFDPNFPCDITEAESQPERSTQYKKNFEDRNKVVLFLKNTFFFIITKRPVKIGILLVILGLSIFFIKSATTLEPDTYQLGIFRENHNYAIATKKHYFSFSRNSDEEESTVYLVWGIRPVDISSCNAKSAQYCKGTPSWDENFDIRSDSAQLAFKNLCDRLERIDGSLANDLRIRRNAITRKLEINCFTTHMDQFYKEEVKRTRYGFRIYPSELVLELPVTPGNVTNFMLSNQYIYQYNLPADFDRYFEILVSYWMANRYTMVASEDYFRYNGLLAEQKIAGITRNAYYTFSGQYYGTKLRYIAIEINTTMNMYTMSYTEGLPVYRKWENFMHEQLSCMPSSLQNGFQVTKDLWHWLHVQESLATSAVTGILVGIFTTWPVLILTSCNYIIGTIATFIIGLVTATVVGIIPLLGWKLGVLESINLCIVVGLSVDYIVHLAEAYRMSRKDRKADRVRDMLEYIGLSILSGAISTVGAAIFMLFAQIKFFFAFGIFIIFTVGTSLIFSLFGFTAVMSLCGPQKTTGSLTELVKSLIRRCCERFCHVKVDGKEESCLCCCSVPCKVRDQEEVVTNSSSRPHHANTSSCQQTDWS